jgi:hypothetical protein
MKKSFGLVPTSMVRSGIARHEGDLTLIKPSDVKTATHGQEDSAAKMGEATVTVPFLGGDDDIPLPL